MPRESGASSIPEALMIDLERRGVLDRPLSRTMTTEGTGSALAHLRPNSFSISASFNST
jgi:hypothetical protein